MSHYLFHFNINWHIYIFTGCHSKPAEINDTPALKLLWLFSSRLPHSVSSSELNGFDQIQIVCTIQASNHVTVFPAVSLTLMLKLCEQVRYLVLMSHDLPFHIILVKERRVYNFRVQTYSCLCNLCRVNEWAGIAQSVLRLATGFTDRWSVPGGGVIFRIRPDRSWGPLSLLYNGYRVFLGGIAAGAWRWPPTPI